MSTTGENNWKQKLQELAKEKGNILTGVWNKFLKKEEIESLYQQRLKVCTERNEGHPCESYTESKEGCAFPNLQPTPCCSNLTGGCGCSIELLLRVPGKSCIKGYWPAVITDEEQVELEKEAYKQQFKKD